jgi:hypothetical protein
MQQQETFMFAQKRHSFSPRRDIHFRPDCPEQLWAHTPSYVMGTRVSCWECETAEVRSYHSAPYGACPFMARTWITLSKTVCVCLFICVCVCVCVCARARARARVRACTMQYKPTHTHAREHNKHTYIHKYNCSLRLE